MASAIQCPVCRGERTVRVSDVDFDTCRRCNGSGIIVQTETHALLNPWRPEPPDEEGMWWLYGEEEFGTMGGNYTGVYLPEIKLRVVDVQTLGNTKELVGVCSGRIIFLKPFDAEKRQPGYIGVWKKVDLPELPKRQ